MKFTNILDAASVDEALLALHQTDLNGKIEMLDYYAKDALGKANLILSRKNLRDALGDGSDSHLDMVLVRSKLEQVETLVNEVRDILK